jgi:hypothetical protein
MKRIVLRSIGACEMVIGLLQAAVAARNLASTDAYRIEYGILAAAGFLSFFLGLGLLLKKRLAVQGLIFFSSGIAFLKFLILGGIFELPPATELLFPKTAENVVSVFYHLAVVFTLFSLSHHRLD